jgi:hypothetical protein
MKPFRWDVKKKEQLGALTKGERSSAYPGFIGELRKCASRLISFSDDGLIAFVGRSPESFFDYLSGVFEGTSKAQDLVLLNISNRYESILEIKSQKYFRYKSLKQHFWECSVSPREILQRKKKTLFADVVATGGTFGQIASFLFSWAKEENLTIKDLRLKLRFLGITWRGKTSPNTWRWQQKVDWVRELQIRNIKNVSAPGTLWNYLGNIQMKVSKQNPLNSWGAESILEPPRAESNLKALRRAYDLFSRGQREKNLFSNILSKEKAVAEEWFRSLILELRVLSNK